MEEKNENYKDHYKSPIQIIEVKQTISDSQTHAMTTDQQM